jgi:hypothetical protein
MSIDPLSLGLTGLGLIGSLFGGEEEMTDEQKRTYESLLSRSQGLDPKLLELMRARLRGSVGNEFSGLTANRMAQLRRQNAPNVIQRQEFEKLASRRAGATSDALLGVDRLNENVKGQALGQLAGFTSRFPQQRGFGQGFSQLFGAGLEGLLRGGDDDVNWMEELLRHKKRGEGFANYDFNKLPTGPTQRIGNVGGI